MSTIKPDLSSDGWLSFVLARDVQTFFLAHHSITSLRVCSKGSEHATLLNAHATPVIHLEDPAIVPNLESFHNLFLKKACGVLDQHEQCSIETAEKLERAVQNTIQLLARTVKSCFKGSAPISHIYESR